MPRVAHAVAARKRRKRVRHDVQLSPQEGKKKGLQVVVDNQDKRGMQVSRSIVFAFYPGA